MLHRAAFLFLPHLVSAALVDSAPASLQVLLFGLPVDYALLLYMVRVFLGVLLVVLFSLVGL